MVVIRNVILSSVGAICPTDHNSNSSQMWFDGGDRYFGDVGVPEPMEEEGSAALAPNLLPHGIEIYVVDEPSSDDDKDLFSRFGVGGQPSVSL